MDGDCEDQNLPAIAPVLKVSPGSLELVEIAPKTDKLKLLLFENLYKCDEYTAMEDSEPTKRGLYKWDDLINKIQASDDELKSGLQILSAVEIDGYWRVVDEKYMDLILRMLLHNSLLNDWTLNALYQDKVMNTLLSDGFPYKLAEHCLSVYGSEINNVGMSGMWRLDEKKVCLHFAREILRVGKMKMGIFMKEWMRKIPEGMLASFEMLEGEVLTERLGVDTWVWAFSVSSLPSTPAERFSILFKERPRWEWKDLRPFIRLTLYIVLSSCS